MRQAVKLIVLAFILIFSFTSCFHLAFESPILEGPVSPGESDDDDDDNNNSGLPLTINSLTLSSDNSTLNLVFNRGAYNSNGAAGALTKDDFNINLTANNGGSSNVTVTSVSHTAGNNAATLGLTVTGNSFGVETITVSAKDSLSIYDSDGVALDVSYESSSITLNNSHLSGYSYRRKVTINSSLVSGSSPLSSFPLLFYLSSADLMQAGSGGFVQNGDGYDIMFTGPDGITPLPFEIDSYDNSVGRLSAWVKIPSLPATWDSFFYIYYGNSSISSSQENRASTWSSAYRTVWHLNESSGGLNCIKDSGPNGFHGTDQGGVLLDQTGKVSKALAFDGLDDYIDLGTGDIIDNSMAFSFSAWIYLNEAPGGNSDYSIWDRRVVPELDSFAFSIGDYVLSGNSQLKVAFSDSGPTLNWRDHLSDNDVPLSSWVYVAAVYDGININFYCNGSPDGAMTYNPSPYAPGFSQAIGRAGGVPGNYYKGLIDELRIANTIRSADWIATEYNNQNNPAAFYTIGPLE